MSSKNGKKPVVLLILDGWGYREDTDNNAIYHAKTPTWDRLWATCPHTLISSSGLSVGLPEGQMGNSEVGHMSLGAGRVIYQNISRIDKAIKDGDFFKNVTYAKAIDKAISKGKAIHILGLVSSGGVHSHENHIHAMIEMAAQRGANNIYVHAFLDGRDTPPRSALSSLQALDDKFAKLGCGRIASIIGRYYAMDRDNRWDRVESAYQLLTSASSDYRSISAQEGLQAAYLRDENDEFVSATVIQADNQEKVIIDDGDSVIFMNFRADRARELTRAFIEKSFNGFARERIPDISAFVMTTEYAADIKAPCAFPPEVINNSFGELMENLGKTQLRIAETEKYAHVTFFFSGGREQLFKGEDRMLIPSPQISTYDLQPEMSAPEVTRQLVEAIGSGKYDTIICNYANGDMVGHTGIFAAAVKAAEAIDESLQKVTEAVLSSGGECLITADHGNCEQMQDYESGQHHTQHTTGPVPFIYVGKREVKITDKIGKLADVSPTMLTLMGIDVPLEMTGHSLLSL